jgi:hypothetical protein
MTEIAKTLTPNEIDQAQAQAWTIAASAGSEI